MRPIAPVLADLAHEIGALTARRGRRVAVEALGLTDRRDALALAPPGGQVSCNGTCRLTPAADGWVAVNLARAEDAALVPAWLELDGGEAAWPAIEAAIATRTCADLVARGALLGLPVAAVGETRASAMEPPVLPLGAPGAQAEDLRVLDLSALWAGPACGAILAATGATVTKVESRSRPDPTWTATPAFGRRLNGGKLHLSLDFGAPDDRARLMALAAEAHVLITSGRPRAFAGLGLPPEAVFAANPALVWVAITGHGWTGAGAERVAFGDDAAAAGGLVSWAEGTPAFLGDALADPITALAAAAGALRALEAGGGVLVDASLARAAAGAAARLGLVA